MSQCMSGAILAGGAQIAHQQLLATEDIHRQETVAVSSNHERTRPPGCCADHADGRSREHQLTRGGFACGAMNRSTSTRCWATAASVHAVFQPAQGGLAGQHLVRPRPLNQGPDHGVVPGGRERSCVPRTSHRPAGATGSAGSSAPPCRSRGSAVPAGSFQNPL